MYFFAEKRVGSIVKYIVQSVSRNEEELAFRSERRERRILVYPFMRRSVIKKKKSYLNLEDELKKKMNSALI